MQIPETKLKVPEYRNLARQIAKDSGDGEIVKAAKEILASDKKNNLNVGINLLLLAKDVPEELMKDTLRRLAEHEDWELREEATQIMRALLTRDFETWFPLLQEFVGSDDVNLKRAAVVGSMATGIKDESKIKKIVEEIYEPMLPSGERYIRINLGPFAFGSYLLRLFPDLAFKYFDRWIEQDDPWTRWNVLMAFSQARAKEYPNEARKYLAKVQDDDRTTVRRAAKTVSAKIKL